MKPGFGYRADIDGLRAIAVLSVIGYHAFPHAVHGGFTGTQVTFISPIDLLCHDGSCLISTDPQSATPLAWDNDHLSLAGSEFLADRAFKSILGAKEPAI
jgi:hypothetical protein